MRSTEAWPFMEGAVLPARYDGRDRPPINLLIQKAAAFSLCSDRISSCDSCMGPNHRILSEPVQSTNALPRVRLAFYGVPSVQNGNFYLMCANGGSLEFGSCGY